VINLASMEVQKVFDAIIKRIEAEKGRIVTRSLNRPKASEVTATIHFEVPAKVAQAISDFVLGQGEVTYQTMTENRDTRNVTETKEGFQVQIMATWMVPPRETITIKLASDDVSNAYKTLHGQIDDWTGRLLDGRLNEGDPSRTTAYLDFEVPRAKEDALSAQLLALGDIFSRDSARARQSQNTIDSKVRVQLTVIDLSQVPPRESMLLALEVGDVDETFAEFRRIVGERKGRIVSSNLARQRSGQIIGKLVCDVPLRTFEAVVKEMESKGNVRVAEASRNPQVPDSDLAIARIDVTVANSPQIIRDDEGIAAKLREGLGTSFTIVTWSIMLIFIGLCAVIPWALIALAVMKIVKVARKRKQAQASA
jgi:hypothetical protein